MGKPIMQTSKTIFNDEYQYDLREVGDTYYELRYIEIGRDTETFTFQKEELVLLAEAINELLQLTEKDKNV